MEKPFTYHENPHLDRHPVSGYKGVPYINDRYYNLERTPLPGFAELVKWQSQRRPFTEAKKKDPYRLPVIRDESFVKSGEEGIMWLGHASWYINMNGVRILIDPVLEGIGPFMPRYSDFPVEHLALKHIDYLLISHDHRDHCDEKSIRYLHRQNPNLKILTGLGLQSLLYGWTRSANIQEAGWYQFFDLAEKDLRISYLPSRHWCRRGAFDINKRLWGGFLIEGSVTIYFGGDSGFGSHFEAFAAHFAPPDIYLAGVGAYKPEWFMGRSHMGPAEAVEAARIIGAKKMLPMHYGTFDLADDRFGEPRELLEEMILSNPDLGKIVLLPVPGEVIKF